MFDIYIYRCIILEAILIASAYSKDLIKEHNNCNLLFSRIEFASNRKCLQIVFDPDRHMDCDIFQSVNSILYQVRAYTSMQTRDILKEPYAQCETFLVIVESYEAAMLLFHQRTSDKTLRLGKHFLPYSRIYFFLSGSTSQSRSINWEDSVAKFLYQNALFGFSIECKENNFILYDLLKKNFVDDSRIKSDLSHPYVDTDLHRENPLRISLFDYAPYNFYTVNDKNET